MLTDWRATAKPNGTAYARLGTADGDDTARSQAGSSSRDLEYSELDDDDGDDDRDFLLEEEPSELDLKTLRRVPGSIPWQAYTIAFVELCERFSYYGTVSVCE